MKQSVASFFRRLLVLAILLGLLIGMVMAPVYAMYGFAILAAFAAFTEICTWLLLIIWGIETVSAYEAIKSIRAWLAAEEHHLDIK